MEKSLKIASWVLIALLLLPMIQHVTHLLPERKLKGAVTLATLPGYSTEHWLNGTFQDSVERAFNDRFGFRNMFIRINNQVAYSLYRKALANGVIIGKDNYLYEIGYIWSQNGDNYIGDSTIRARAEQIKELQEYFEQQGKHFVVIFAAGKGSFYPEYIPDRFAKSTDPAISSKSTNLDEYANNFDHIGVNYINFNKWFLEMKDTSEYSLFPRTGTHWSYYGMVLVIDSLHNYIGDVTGRELPPIEIGEIELSRDYKASDSDIELSMNILFRVNRDMLAYPKIRMVETDIDKLRGIVIADSFYWGLHNLGFSSHVFDKGEFWFYNRLAYSRSFDGRASLDTLNRRERLENADVIILMATEATLPKFPYGIENVLK